MNYRNRTWIETDMNKATANFLKIKEIAEGKKLFAVVKANAYGHGAVRLSKLYQKLGADGFCVSNIGEALELRKAGITMDILILGYTPYEHANELIANNIIQTVYSLEYAERLNEFASKIGETVRVHIKLDSGMGRLGFDLRQGVNGGIKDEFSSLLALSNLKFEGVFTHFATADSNDTDDEKYTDNQYENFKAGVELLEKLGAKFNLIHSDNSAAILKRKDSICNALRPGIILYGYQPSEGLCEDIELSPVMSVKSVISMVKILKKGESVSYGRLFTANEDMTVATVPVGYADGYPRYLSGKGFVLIKGEKAPIIGRVCMDQMMVDISGIEGVSIGDTVTLIGTDGNSEITAEDIAKIGNTISYEVICGFAPRVEKFYI